MFLSSWVPNLFCIQTICPCLSQPWVPKFFQNCRLIMLGTVKPRQEDSKFKTCLDTGWVQGQPRIARPCLEIMIGGCVLVTECLPGMCKALNSILSLQKCILNIKRIAGNTQKIVRYHWNLALIAPISTWTLSLGTRIQSGGKIKAVRSSW